MRVAHFCDCEPTRADGVAASASLAVGLLRAAGHHVDHYYPGPLFGGGMRSVPVPLRAVRMAMPWARVDAPVDLVHVHTTGPVGMAGFRLAATRGVPLVLTWHTDLLAYADHFPEVPIGAAYCAVRMGLGWSVRETLDLAYRGDRRQARLRTLGRAMMAAASLVIAPSPKTAAGLAGFAPLPPVRVLPTPAVLPGAPAVLPDGPAVLPGAPVGGDDLRAGLGIPPGAAVVLSVGRVTPEKDPLLLLRAFARVRASRPDTVLVVLGARQGRRAVSAAARGHGIADAVRLVRPVPRHQVAAFYRMSDVLVSASTTDTQSLVIAEAEAAGLPVVSADAALGRITCEPAPAPLASAILRLLDDAHLRGRIRAAGLAATRDYPPGRYLSLLTAAYEDAGRAAASRPEA